MSTTSVAGLDTSCNSNSNDGGCPKNGRNGIDDALAKSKRSNLSSFCNLLGYASSGERRNDTNMQTNPLQHHGGGVQPVPGMAMPFNPLLQKSTLGKYLYKDDNDAILGGAVCSLPSLEFDLSEEEGRNGLTSADGNQALSPSASSSTIQTDPTNKKSDIKTNTDPANNGTKVGEDMKATAFSSPPTQIPAMAASVLESILSNDNDSMTLLHKTPDLASSSSSTSSTSTSSSTNNHQFNNNTTSEQMEQIAAQYLSQRTCWTRSSIPQIPFALSRSLAASFSTIIDSRVKAWTLLLLRNSLSCGDEKSRSRLLTMLATRNSINMSSLRTEFQVGDAIVDSTSDKGDDMNSNNNEQETSQNSNVEAHVSDGRSHENHSDNSNKTQEENDASSTSHETCEIMLPIKFDAEIEMTMQGRLFTVHLQAPGTIAANFHKSTNLMTFVECRLDTKALAKDMMKQARLVVFEAVARATNSPNPLPKDITTNPSATAIPTTATGKSADQDLSSFQSALSISPNYHSMSSPANMDIQDMQLKASASQKFLSVMTSKIPETPSAIRNSSTTNVSAITMAHSTGILNKDNERNFPTSGSTVEKVSKLAKGSKQRSVQWDLPDDMIRSKRRKLNIDKPLKRSKISFGKPEADTFSSVRNATFGEFGRITRTGIVAADNTTTTSTYHQYGAQSGMFPTQNGLNGTRNHTFAALNQHNGMNSSVGTGRATNESFGAVQPKPYAQPIGSMLLDTITRKNHS